MALGEVLRLPSFHVVLPHARIQHTVWTVLAYYLLAAQGTIISPTFLANTYAGVLWNNACALLLHVKLDSSMTWDAGKTWQGCAWGTLAGSWVHFLPCLDCDI